MSFFYGVKTEVERVYPMENNPKSYAIVYLASTTTDEEMKAIEALLKNQKIDIDMFDSKNAYQDWCRDKNSINPSLFISNKIDIIGEYQFINDKLLNAAILLVGKLDHIISPTKEGSPSDKGNLLGKFKDIPAMVRYLESTAFITPKFTERVVGNGLAKPNNAPEGKKEGDVSSKDAPKNEEPGQLNATNSNANITLSAPEKVLNEQEQPNVPSTPSFEDDDEKLNKQLSTITEIAKKTKVPLTEAAPTTKPSASTTNNETSIVYAENPYYQRSRHLQKQVFAKQKWENHRKIGVWSPLHRMGVTSFTINLALFLAENRVYTAVLEGLTEKHALKSWLQRYTSIPNNWSSYAKAIHTDGHTNETGWMYRDVMFLPLDTNDPQFEWNAQSLESYMTATNIIDITLVDFPTGKMTAYTEDSLHYVDELWILIDDATQEILAWKEYINIIQQKINIPVYLIFNKTYDFSQVEKVSSEFKIPLLTKIPSLHEETMRNYYEVIPLYCKKEVQEKVQIPFSDIAKHLLGEEFIINEKIPTFPKEKWYAPMLKILKKN